MNTCATSSGIHVHHRYSWITDPLQVLSIAAVQCICDCTVGALLPSPSAPPKCPLSDHQSMRAYPHPHDHVDLALGLAPVRDPMAELKALPR